MYAINNVSQSWFNKVAVLIIVAGHEVPNPNSEEMTRLYWGYSHSPEMAAELLLKSLLLKGI